ncbi:potassium/sodium hyperpolarization-activated cyclic nucleotide-gated channel 2-like isoform X2 [Cylas formicarius]|uniref:potassium/sodium hyperpolarization-activated cyclic nucleotide-gated channel 2-like isoform X2 n=1 Tax=Cylas formicarius TaxID=197179 RepID=UPI00295868E6|nr:potassium/sodium hyperpolarization-activated cyclic nucleotide-gated channel 2-like isoform X2 [Cylas formicarius]
MDKMQKNTTLLFAKYGHECTLEDLPQEYPDIPGRGLWKKIRKMLIRMCVVSDSSKLYTHHLRSFGAIVKERERQILYYRWRIHPFSKASLYWSLVMIVIIFIELIITPVDFLLYDMKKTFIYSVQWKIVTWIPNIFFLIHLIANFWTGYYDEPNQEVVLSLKRIAKNYVKTFLIIDVIACLPNHLDFVFNAGARAVFIFQAVSMLKYLMVVRFYKYLKISAEILGINYYTYMITLVMALIMLFWHSTCCMLTFLRRYLGAEVNDIFEPSVKTFYRVLEGSLIIYNSSYGRTLPSTEKEILLIWFGWYASSLFFIYILALIMEIMHGKQSASHKYVKIERQLMDYMRHKQLPTQMRRRILTYHEFRFHKSYFHENKILGTISEQLRQEINMHACRKLVESVIFFRNLPLNLLVRIISCLRIEVYLVNDVIIRANTPGTNMYFISTGTVAIYSKSGTEICHLEEGSHVGEVALIIKGVLRTASVIAVEVSELYRLDQKDFVKAISPYPDLLANIHRIAADRMEASSMLEDYKMKEASKR